MVPDWDAPGGSSEQLLSHSISHAIETQSSWSCCRVQRWPSACPASREPRGSRTKPRFAPLLKKKKKKTSDYKSSCIEGFSPCPPHPRPKSASRDSKTGHQNDGNGSVPAAAVKIKIRPKTPSLRVSPMRPRIWTALLSDQSLGPTTKLFDFEKTKKVTHRNAFFQGGKKNCRKSSPLIAVVPRHVDAVASRSL